MKPVFIVNGFLESGKTTFIQDILEGSDFNAGERTLLLMCEQGEVELDESKLTDTIKDLQILSRKIEHALNSAIGLSVKVTLVEPKTITRSEGKAVRVVDRRK